jgi:hypothetical protein
MRITAEHLASIGRFGYTETEAAFLYLVVTHSGHFTQRQFLNFADVQKGGAAWRLSHKAAELGHVRSTRYANEILVYNLYSRLIYRAIDRENLRNRRRLSKDLVRTRLLILDFILSHPDLHYLETETDKVRYFHQERGLSLAVLPGRIYKGIKAAQNTKRYFVDRFPIFLPHDQNPLALAPAPTFVYCDSTAPGLLRFVSYLRSYERFLGLLPEFNLIYACADSAKFRRARKFFAGLFGQDSQSELDLLIGYFRVRKLWEDHKTSSLTRADRDILRSGDRRFCDDPFETAYRKWAGGELSEASLNDVLERRGQRQKRHFSTFELPEGYDIFERISKDYGMSKSGTVVQNRRSAGSSALGSTPVGAN